MVRNDAAHTRVNCPHAPSCPLPLPTPPPCSCSTESGTDTCAAPGGTGTPEGDTCYAFDILSPPDTVTYNAPCLDSCEDEAIEAAAEAARKKAEASNRRLLALLRAETPEQRRTLLQDGDCCRCQKSTGTISHVCPGTEGEDIFVSDGGVVSL